MGDSGLRLWLNPGYPAAEAVDRVTAAFEEVRYAEREPSPQALAALEEDVDAVRKTRVG